jgi:hypothetical protein
MAAVEDMLITLGGFKGSGYTFIDLITPNPTVPNVIPLLPVTTSPHKSQDSPEKHVNKIETPIEKTEQKKVKNVKP